MNEKRRNQIHLEEIGAKADSSTVREISKEIFSSWKFKGKTPQKPVLLYLGGFQGSGKTTALDLIKKDLQLAVISPDEIRHKLFERRWKVNEEFVHTVNATRNNLLRKALSLGYHIAIDQLTTEERIKLVRKIAEEVNPRYKTIAVYLEASQSTLEERVVSRADLLGRYKGTLNELRHSLKLHGNQSFGLYDRVIHSDMIDPQEIANELRSFF